jgi:hypothetical protein
VCAPCIHGHMLPHMATRLTCWPLPIGSSPRVLWLMHGIAGLTNHLRPLYSDYPLVRLFMVYTLMFYVDPSRSCGTYIGPRFQFVTIACAIGYVKRSCGMVLRRGLRPSPSPFPRHINIETNLNNISPIYVISTTRRLSG